MKLVLLLIILAIFGLTSPAAHVYAQGNPVELRPQVFEEGFPIHGSGFQPHEEITLTIRSSRGVRTFNTTADEQGRFSLVTGLTHDDIGLAPPYRGFIYIQAEGNKGSRREMHVTWTTSATGPPVVDQPSLLNAELDYPIPNGHFYTQTSSQGGPVGSGFAVTDEAGVQLWSEFQRLGGVEGVGYPISQRFIWDGFVSQAFQKMVFQWRPEEGRVYAVNVIDLMHERGLDEWLRTHRATPPSAEWSSDAGRSWEAIVAAHQALLTDPDIRAAYFAVADPVTLYGLPMAPIQDMGSVLVLRAQRGIIQKWLTDMPWARAGQVTIANSGEVAKEAELLPPDALRPMASP